MNANSNIVRQIAELKQRLDALNHERKQIVERLTELEKLRAIPIAPPIQVRVAASVTMTTSTVAKIALFRNLFRGRGDVFPRRWDNAKTGKTGYSPACRNEWVRGVCGKPHVRCGDCPNQAFQSVTDDIIRGHPQGRLGTTQGDFTAGVYPMLLDETCWFLAADFDKRSWISVQTP